MSQSTFSIRTRHKINAKSLEAYLQKVILGFTAPLYISQFNHGQSNPTYLLKDGNQQQYVLRKKPPGVSISKTAHAVRREYRIICALGENSDIPVPKVYTLCEDVDVISTPFYIMELLKGRIFTDVRAFDLPFEERREYWFLAIDTLGKLHSVNFKSIGLEGYGKDNEFYARQTRSLGNVSDA